MLKEDLEQSRPKPELEKQKLEQEKLTQEKECPESKEQEKQRKRKKSSRMFWGTIIVLLVVYFSVKFFAYSEPSQEAKADKPKKLFKVVEKILPTDIIKDNLNNHQSKINAALNSGIEEMNGKINTQIDGFFDQVENNVDKFLDWHYSIKGDYSELALFCS
ncbi:hypothetical protein [Helicobacter pylori]|uniref:hypothetical protein n=1 Tax=Helicobacter pylori TaxID=210 RepID=UPI003F5AEDC6